MGSLAIAFLQSTPNTNTMKYCSALLVLAFAAYAQAGQWVYVEDYHPPAAPEYRHLSRRAAQEAEPLRYAPAPLAPAPQYEQDLSVAGSTAYAKGPKTTGWFGLISKVFLPDIMLICSLFWKACAFITRSSVKSVKLSFHQSVKGLYMSLILEKRFFSSSDSSNFTSAFWMDTNFLPS